jgi:hypothetical protein
MNVLDQMERDLGRVMDAPHGDSIFISILPEGEPRVTNIPGKFDAAYMPVNPGSQATVSSAAPTAFLRQQQLEGVLSRELTKRDRLRIAGRTYKPVEIMPDGFGLITIRLQVSS